MNLKNSKVLRGGVSSSHWYGNTDRISATTDPNGSVKFRFTLPSKGGGETKVELTVAQNDLRALLKELAAESPSAAKLFVACTQVAVSSLLARPGAAEDAA